MRVVLKLRSLEMHPPRLCRFAVFLIQTNFLAGSSLPPLVFWRVLFADSALGCMGGSRWGWILAIIFHATHTSFPKVYKQAVPSDDYPLLKNRTPCCPLNSSVHTSSEKDVVKGRWWRSVDGILSMQPESSASWHTQTLVPAPAHTETTIGHVVIPRLL